VKLIEGPSADPAVVAQVKAKIPAGASVMVVLDSDHSHDHVLAELRSYGPLVTKAASRGRRHHSRTRRPEAAAARSLKVLLKGNEPLSALQAYLKETDRFEPDSGHQRQADPFKSPGGYLRCRSGTWSVSLSASD